MTSRVQGVAAGAAVIALATAFARLTGFVRTLVFAGAVKTGDVGTAYQSVNTVPNVVYEVAAGGMLAAVAVPLVARHVGASRPGLAHHTTNAFLTWVTITLIPAAALVWLLAHPISRWLLGAGGTAQVELGATMLRIFAPQIPLYGIGIVLSGLLQGHRRFLGPAVAPLVSSLVVIATYLTYGAMTAPSAQPTSSAVALLAWGTTGGVLALSLPLMVPAWRTGWRPRWRWRFAPGDAHRAGALATAGIVTLIAQQLAVVVTLWLTNHRGGTGVIVVYQYVQAIYLLPYALLAVPVAMAAFPALAGAVDDQEDHARGTLRASVHALIALTGVGAAVLVAAAGPIQSFFAALDAQGSGTAGPALPALAPGLIAFAPGLVGFGLSALLLRAVYARGRPLQAALAVGAGWMVAALMPLALLASADANPRHTLVVVGVCSSVGMSLSAIMLLALVRRTWGTQVSTGLSRPLFAAGVAGLAGALVGTLAVELLSHGPDAPLWQIVASGAIGGAAGLLAFVPIYALLDRAGARALAGRLTQRGGR